MPAGTAHHIRPGRREVLARAGVVDAAVRGRREHALDPAYLLRDVEVGAVELGDRLVGQLLHPVAERLLAGDVAGRLGVERGDRVVDRAAGHDLVRDRYASRIRAGPARRSPRRTSRRGRSWRRGRTATPARSAPGRRPPCRRPWRPARRGGTPRSRAWRRGRRRHRGRDRRPARRTTRSGRDRRSTRPG